MTEKDPLHEKTSLLISYLLKITFLIILLFIALPNQDYLWITSSAISLFLSLIPTILRYLKIFTLPGIIDLMITLALFMHVGIGGVFDLYLAYPNFDILTHYFSGFLVAFLIFTALYLVDLNWDEFKIHPYAIAIGTIIGTMALGVIWEWAEWIGDYLFNLQSQLDLFDTMLDLLMDTIGALSMALLGIRMHNKGEYKTFVSQLEKDTEALIQKTQQIPKKHKNKT